MMIDRQFCPLKQGATWYQPGRPFVPQPDLVQVTNPVAPQPDLVLVEHLFDESTVQNVLKSLLKKSGTKPNSSQ